MTRRSGAAALAVVALVVAAGCGSATAGSALTYENQQYGFTMAYPHGYVVAQTPATKDSPVKFAVAFADPKGSTANGHLIDAVSIEVYKLNQVATPAKVADHAADFESMLRSLLRRDKQVQFAGPPAAAQVNGTTVFSVTYTYQVGDVDVGAMTYLIPNGRYAVVITGQTTRDKWESEGRTLGSMMETFRFTR